MSRSVAAAAWAPVAVAPRRLRSRNRRPRRPRPSPSSSSSSSGCRAAPVVRAVADRLPSRGCRRCRPVAGRRWSRSSARLSLAAVGSRRGCSSAPGASGCSASLSLGRRSRSRRPLVRRSTSAVASAVRRPCRRPCSSASSRRSVGGRERRRLAVGLDGGADGCRRRAPSSLVVGALGLGVGRRPACRPSAERRGAAAAGAAASAPAPRAGVGRAVRRPDRRSRAALAGRDQPRLRMPEAPLRRLVGRAPRRAGRYHARQRALRRAEPRPGARSRSEIARHAGCR